MTVAFCIPTYNSFDKCVEAIHAVMRSSLIPDLLVIIDDSGTGASLPTLVPVLSEYHQQGRNVLLWVHERRCGVATSWNQFFRDTNHDYVIIGNDDAIVHTHTIEQLVNTANEYPEEIFFPADGQNGNTFSLFLLTRRGYELIGEFDEVFWPAYFEDDDYSRRITLAGFKHMNVIGASYDHAGSSTLKTYTDAERQQHHVRFRANRDYFRYKWGGEPGHAIYHTPFNKPIQ